MRWGFWLLGIIPIIASQIARNETTVDPEFSVDPNFDVETTLMELAGGDIDSYGCIASAGYVWCDDIGVKECIRSWETLCDLIEVDTPH